MSQPLLDAVTLRLNRATPWWMQMSAYIGGDIDADDEALPLNPFVRPGEPHI